MSGSCRDAGPEPATGPGIYVVFLMVGLAPRCGAINAVFKVEPSAFLSFAHIPLYQAFPQIHVELIDIVAGALYSGFTTTFYTRRTGFPAESTARHRNNVVLTLVACYRLAKNGTGSDHDDNDERHRDGSPRSPQGTSGGQG